MHATKILGAFYLLLLFLTNITHARVHVQVINQLESGRRLSVHCRSREDDIHHQILEPGDAIEWNFKLNFLRTTLFYCDVQWENSSWYHFDAYDANRDYRRCMSLCRWMIAKDGLLYGYDEDKGFWKMFPFIPRKSRFLISHGWGTEIEGQSFDSPKIRLLRSLYIEGSDGMQVLDLAIFPRSEFDLPIFCANFFSTAAINIVVLDLNPLHDVITQQNYKKKYYTHLIPLGLKYGELLPWGGKITAESMKFFSPIVIWSKFLPSEHNHHLLYSAFKDYLKSWLELMDHASAETDVSRIMVNLEAQHKYLTWRAEKDPGHQVLRRLVGETRAKEIVINSFLFDGVDELGGRTFIDYFPEYKCDDGTVNKKRSMIGKSFESRPWDSRGEFIGDDLR